MRNGYIPDDALGTIPGTGQQILRALVPQTAAMRAAFAARFGKPLVITDAYRDYDAQVRVKKAKGVYAATPGTSNHGWGRALDLGSGVNDEGSPEYRWMKANGPTFGWSHPRWAEDNNPANGQEEPWHWESPETPVPASNYQPIGGTVPVIPDIDAPDPLTPITPEEITVELEDTLRLLRRKTDGAVVAKDLTNGSVRPVTLAAYENLGALGIRDRMWFKNANGVNLDAMDPDPFAAIVGLLGGSV